jgi:hypothetical protein
MKKIFTVAFLAVLAGLVPAAAQTGNVAVGPVYSLALYDLVQSPLQGLGVTGKIPGLAPLFGLNFKFDAKGQYYFVGTTADWLLYKQPLYEPFNLNFYLGPGFYTSLVISAQSRFDLGLRIPVGINWVPLKFFETFFELTPAFGITFQDPIQPAWLFQAALGARVWF